MPNTLRDLWKSKLTFREKLVRSPLRFIPRGTVLPIFAGMNRGLRWRTGSSVHQCWLGTYEREKQRRVMSMVRPGSIVWDIGANAGFYTLGFSRLVGPTGRVYAFEPLPENLQNLLVHLALNDVTNATVVQGALSDRGGISPFAMAKSNALGALASEGELWVSTLAVDEFLRRFPETEPDVMKIDAEGAESRILEGACHLLERGRVELLIALHSNQQWEECLRILVGHRYVCTSFEGESIELGTQPRADILARSSQGSAGAERRRTGR